MNFLKQTLIFIYVLSTSINAHSRCYSPDDSAVVSSNKEVTLGRCIEPIAIGDNNYGWNILRNTLDKSTRRTSFTTYAYPANTNYDQFEREKYTLKSGKVLGERCSLLINTPGLFYTKKDKNGNPKADGTTKGHLQAFWKSIQSLDEKEERVKRGFADNIAVDPSKRMYDSNDDSTNPKGQSTCSALGMCACGVGLSCTEVSSFSGITEPEPFGNQGDYTRVVSENNFYFDLNKSSYKKKDNWCYTLKTCESGDESPRKKCLDDGREAHWCEDIDNRCLYTSACKLPVTSVSYNTDNLPTCEHSFECGSGYCEQLPDSILKKIGDGDTIAHINNTKICLPYAECAPTCVENEKSITQNNQYCCAGLLNVGGTCRTLADGFELPPEMYIDEQNAESCNYKIAFRNNTGEAFCLGAEHWGTKEECESEFKWHPGTSETYCVVNGFRNNDIEEEQCLSGDWFDNPDFLKMRYMYYTRLFEGLQWLWGTANSPGRYDTFGVNDTAVKTFERFYTSNQIINDRFYELMNNVKIKFASAAQEEGAATGVNTIVALSEMYAELSILDQLRSDLYFEISGVEAILDPPTDMASIQNLINYGNARASASLTDYKISGENVVGGKTLWENETIVGLFKKVNSHKPLNNGDASLRYDAHQGQKDCGIVRKKIGKTNSWCMNTKVNPNKPVRCAYSYVDGGVNDGDCIKEGWRIDDGAGGYHGSPGAGGLIDGIYPDSLNSSLFNIEKEKLYTFIESALFTSANAFFFGPKRVRTGLNKGSISSGVLLERIKRDWTAYATNNYTMETACIGEIRPTVPGSISMEEAFFIEKYANENTALTMDQFSENYKRFTKEQKREKFLEFGTRILYDFFVRFHFHKHDTGKGTYRFYKDNQNNGEYNGVVELINGALWLIEFHKLNAEVNEKIGTCLAGKAQQLSQSLESGGNSLDGDGYKEMVGNLSADFPNCPEGQENQGSGGGNTSDAGSGASNIEVEEAGLIAKEKTNSLKSSKAKKIGSSSSTNLSENGQLISNNTLKGDPSDSGKSTAVFSGKLRAARKKANAKISETRKLTLKNKKAPTNFLSELAKKLSNFKNPVSRLQTLQSTTQKTPKFVSLGLPKGVVGKKSVKNKVKENLKKDRMLPSASSRKSAFDDRSEKDEKEVVINLNNDEEVEEISPELKKLLKAAQRNSSKYKKEEGDSLFLIISKSYMTSGVNRLLKPKTKKLSTELPSTKKKKYNKKRKWID